MSGLFGFSSTEYMILLIMSWLDFYDYGLLDKALTNVEERKLWMTCLLSTNMKDLKGINYSHSLLRWLIQRRIRPYNIDSRGEKVDDRSFVGIDSSLLDTLALRACKITDTGLLAIVEGSPRLRTFHACKCSYISSNGIMGLSVGCNDLREISLDGCNGLSDRWLSCIAKGCPELTAFAIARSLYVTDTGISWIAGGCRKLDRLTIDNCGNITNSGLRALASGCPDLRIITLLSCLKISDTGVSAMALKCRNLESFLLYHSDITDASLVALAEYSSLQSVSFRFCSHITLSGLSILAAECTSLQYIQLTSCGKISDSENITTLRSKYVPEQDKSEVPSEKSSHKSVMSRLRYYCSC